MDFVDKGIPNDQCVDQLIEQQNKQTNFILNSTTMNSRNSDGTINFDFKVFNELENGLFDLKLDYSNETANKLKIENLKLNHFSIEHKTELDNYKLLTNGNQLNGNLNHLNPSSIEMNGNSNYLRFNQSAKFNLDHPNFNNSNLISQSYEYAKIANEFKEKLNDVFTAISFYTKAIELNPNEFRFYCNRSICLQQANRLNEALDDANTAINLMPNARKPLLRKSEIYAILNKYNDAENVLNYSLKLDKATDIPVEVIHEEIQKLIKTVLTKCGINSSIIKQTNHCKSIEEAIDYAFSKQMEEKLNSQKFNASTANNTLNNEKSYASAVSLDKHQKSNISNLKSLDSQETIDNLTDEELNNIGTPNRKLSINEELFTFNIQSPLRKDSFSFNQLDTAKHLLHLNNNNLIENSSSLANINNGKFANYLHQQQQQYSTSNRHQPIDIPIMNRKRNSISLCEPSDNNSFSIKSLNNFTHFSNDYDAVLNSGFKSFLNEITEPIYSKSLGSNLSLPNKNYITKNEGINNSNIDFIDPKYKEAVERANICTNLIGYKGLWLGT